MSQSGSYFVTGGTSTVTKLTGNTGGAVGPSSGNINIVGSGTVAVTGNPLTSTLTISSSGSTAASFPTDSGTAIPALGALTVAGGANIGTTGSGSTVTINLDPSVSGLSELTMANGGIIGTGTSNGDTAVISAYDTGSSSYTTFATLTANPVPTMDISDSVTKAGSYIYRAGGTDVAIADGGTGLSTTPINGQLLIGNSTTSSYNLGTITAGNGIAITNGAGSITASITNGTNGQLLIGGGSNATWATPTSTGSTIAITGGANTLNFETGSAVLKRFNTDAGIATPSGGIVNLLGGTNIGSTGSGSTVTLNLDANLTNISSVTTTSGGSLRTGTTAADTTLLNAYNTGTASYTTFGTLTAGAVPTMDLSDSVTKASNYIYRAGGTDVAITDGGTGISTTPTDGQILVGKTATNDYTLTTLTPGTGIGITNGSGSVTIAASASVPTSFVTDSGTATPALNSLTVTGGTNIGTTGSGSTVTVNLDSSISGLSAVDLATGGRLGTSTSAGNTALLQAYDVDGAGYITFATLTANNTPTMDLASDVTINSSYIYRAGGTDVAIADGGTGLSTTPTDGQLLIGKTATNNYSLATLTAGANVTITNGSGTISIAASGGNPWSVYSGGDFTMAVNNNYVVTSSCIATLPATSSIGATIWVTYYGTDSRAVFNIGQNAGQSILFGSSATTTGTGGSMVNVNRGDGVLLVCTIANTQWVVVASTGNWGVV